MKYLSSLLVVLTSVALIGCAHENNTPGGSGFIETDEVIVSAETTGRVTALLVDEGDAVMQQDTLVHLDSSRVALQLAASRAGREVARQHLAAARIGVEQAANKEAFAKTEFSRVSKLHESGTATQRQFDQADEALDQARLAHRSARASVGSLQAEIERINAEIARLEREYRDCFPLAPIRGAVLEKYTEVGELLTPGKPIIKMARLDTVWVKVYLGAGDFSHIKPGDSATVNTESGGTTYPGRVTWTSDQAEFTPKNVQTEESRADLVYAVKVRLANPDRTLKIGMPVYVTLEK